MASGRAATESTWFWRYPASPRASAGLATLGEPGEGRRLVRTGAREILVSKLEPDVLARVQQTMLGLGDLLSPAAVRERYDAIAAAARIVQRGDNVVVIAGAAQALQQPLLEHLRAQGFASREPARPFDTRHGGFVAAEAGLGAIAGEEGGRGAHAGSSFAPTGSPGGGEAS